jgi:hypothetical protein
LIAEFHSLPMVWAIVQFRHRFRVIESGPIL